MIATRPWMTNAEDRAIEISAARETALQMALLWRPIATPSPYAIVDRAADFAAFLMEYPASGQQALELAHQLPGAGNMETVNILNAARQFEAFLACTDTPVSMAA